MTLTIQYQPVQITEGTIVSLSAEPPNTSKRYIYKWEIEGGALTEPPDRQTGRSVHWDTTGLVPGAYSVKVTAELDPAIKPTTSAPATDTGEELIAIAVRPLSRDDVLPVALRRTTTQPTRDQALWVAIRNRTKAIAFSGSGYKDFIDSVLCDQTTPPGDARLRREMAELGSQVRGVGAYELLKTATEVFLLLNCGVEIKDDAHVRFDSDEEATRLGERVPLHVLRRRLENYLGDPRRLPYIKRVLDAAFPGKEEDDSVFCDDVVIASRVDGPCMLELIWSYWHEEGMLVQAMNAISLRFQNRRNGSDRDPLAHLEIAPVRPLNNLLWGYVQDEQNRLTVQRRAYEYDHHYGLKLVGKVVPQLRSADSRSKFLEGYHNLLHRGDALLSRRRRYDPPRRCLPAAECTKRNAPDSGAGGAQPVWRSAMDGAHRDVDSAMAAVTAGNARLPAKPPDGAVSRSVDGTGGYPEATGRLDGRQRVALSRSGRVR